MTITEKDLATIFREFERKGLVVVPRQALQRNPAPPSSAPSPYPYPYPYPPQPSSGGGGRVVRNITNIIQSDVFYYNAVTDYGAPNDGSSDAYPAIQAMLDQIQQDALLGVKTYGFLPSGTYDYSQTPVQAGPRRVLRPELGEADMLR